MSLAARIEGVGLVGPGLASWSEGCILLGGSGAYVSRPTVLPAPDVLPANERRRAGKSVKLALAAGLEAVRASGRAAADFAAVFASSSGDGENCHSICETLASDDRSISPTRFHNSVHNAPSGYWGIATGAMRPADCVGAYDASFGAGLMEAMTRLASEPSQPVLLIAYDAPYPEPLNGARPIADAFAVALALAAPAHSQHGPLMSLDFLREPSPAMADGAFESLRRGIPAARSLPLLLLLAAEAQGQATIEYLEGLSLRLGIAS
jgi:hypothetical protein